MAAKLVAVTTSPLNKRLDGRQLPATPDWGLACSVATLASRSRRNATKYLRAMLRGAPREDLSRGDIQGGDLPGWLGELHGAAFIATLGSRPSFALARGWKACPS